MRNGFAKKSSCGRAGRRRSRRSPELPTYDPDDIDEVPGAEAEAAEEQILDQATAAQTLAELEAEIAILTDLEDRALRLKLSGQDAKWRQLESILDEPIMLDPTTGLRRKILIFTEPKDTLEYLAHNVVGLECPSLVILAPRPATVPPQLVVDQCVRDGRLLS